MTFPGGPSHTRKTVSINQGGVNELTAKISCFGDGSTPVSEWHSINVTGGSARVRIQYLLPKIQLRQMGESKTSLL